MRDQTLSSISSRFLHAHNWPGDQPTLRWGADWTFCTAGNRFVAFPFYFSSQLPGPMIFPWLVVQLTVKYREIDDFSLESRTRCRGGQSAKDTYTGNINMIYFSYVSRWRFQMGKCFSTDFGTGVGWEYTNKRKLGVTRNPGDRKTQSRTTTVILFRCGETEISTFNSRLMCAARLDFLFVFLCASPSHAGWYN